MTLAELQSAGQVVAPEPAKAGAAAPRSRPRCAGIALDRSIFRAYDIRGVVGQTLDANIARLIGQAIGTRDARDATSAAIVVGRDGRLSSPSMAGALIEGLRKAGREVIDIGEVPTPMAYFATFHLRTGCCVSVTGSHNPPDYNGFKIVVGGETLSGDAIQNLYVRIAENRLHRADALGLLSSRDIKADYIERIAGDIQIERKLKVVLDCGNGVAGAIAPGAAGGDRRRGRAAVLRRRRQVPAPPSRSERAGEPARPDRRGAAHRRRHRPGPRRRRRPPGRGHQERRDHLSRPPADAVRHRRARAQPGRLRDLRRQVHRPPGHAHPAPRRQPDDVEDRAFADQGEDEGNRGRARRRDERPLLLPRALVRLRRRPVRGGAPARDPRRLAGRSPRPCSPNCPRACPRPS